MIRQSLWALALSGILHALPVPAAAQQQSWSLSAEVGWAGISGASRDPQTGAAFRPANGLVLGLAIARQSVAFHLGLVLRTQQSDLTIADSQVTIITNDLGFRRYEVAPELGIRLLRVSRYATINLAAGPVIELWRVTDSKSRTRIGGRAALTLESLVADGVSGVVRAEGAATGSMFDEGELPPEFGQRRTLRGVVTVGIKYSWN